MKHHHVITKPFLCIGLLLITACSSPTTSETMIIADETVVVDEEARNALLELTEDGHLRFETDTALLNNLTVGDILVSEPSAAAPEGFLRKVTAINRPGSEIVLATEPAALTEAVLAGNVSASIALTKDKIESSEALIEGASLGLDTALPDDLIVLQDDEKGITLSVNSVIFDKDGQETTKKDQVRIEGSVKLEATYDFDLDLDFNPTLSNPFNVDIDVFKAEVGLTEEAKLELTGQLKETLKKELPIYTLNFKPEVFFIGPVPVVITLKLTLVVGLDGKLEAKANFRTTQTFSAKAGVLCDPKCRDTSTSSNDFKDSEASFEGKLTLKGYAGAKLDTRLYGVIGPYMQVNAYLEMQGQIPQDPIWVLYAGLEGKVGINNIKILGEKLKYGPEEIFDLRQRIAQADNSPPSVTILQPDNNTEVLLNRTIGLLAEVSDPEQGGTACCSHRWVSDRMGLISTSNFADYTVLSEGEHIITLQVTDGEGETSEASVTIQGINVAPEPFITRPDAGTEIRAEVATTLLGGASDANEDFGSAAAFSCAGLRWESSLASDPFPQTGCQVDVTFAAAGPRTLTLTATDPQGLNAVTGIDITVLDPPVNFPPIVSITSPANNAEFNGSGSDLIEFTASATDAEGDTPLGYEWTATFNGQTRVIGSALTTEWRPSDNFSIPCEGGPYVIRITFKATDSRGNAGLTFIDIRRPFRIC